MAMVYISVGSNLKDREGNIKEAIELIGKDPKIRIKKVSSLYETEPVLMRDQPWFLNAVLEIETLLLPEEILSIIHGIECRLGRLRKVKWGPRVIDLDILLFGDLIIEDPLLKVPHPELHKRNFTLIPLAEISPETRHPLLNKTIQELLIKSLDKSKVRRWEG